MLSFHGGSDLFLLLTQARLMIIQTTFVWDIEDIWNIFFPPKATHTYKMT